MDKTVPPGRVKGTLTPPCSKSYAQRALAAALLSEEVSVLRNIEFCDDTRSALQCIETLGARVRRVDPTSLSIEGGLSPKGCVLNVGESGLSTRLFTPVASLCPTPVTIEGRGSLLRRPMQMMFEPLRRLGVRVRDNGGFLPIEVCGPIQGGEAEVDGSVSSQFITGLLLALPLARRDTSLHVRGAVSTPYLDMTLDTAARFGIEISQRDYEEFYIPGRQRYRSTYFSIEGDWSAAAMLLVAGATAGEVTVRNASMLSKQADTAICTALVRAGAAVINEEDSVTALHRPLRAFEFDATNCPDLFPALAALGYTEGDGMAAALRQQGGQGVHILDGQGEQDLPGQHLAIQIVLGHHGAQQRRVVLGGGQHLHPAAQQVAVLDVQHGAAGPGGAGVHAPHVGVGTDAGDDLLVLGQDSQRPHLIPQGGGLFKVQRLGSVVHPGGQLRRHLPQPPLKQPHCLFDAAAVLGGVRPVGAAEAVAPPDMVVQAGTLLADIPWEPAGAGGQAQGGAHRVDGVPRLTAPAEGAEKPGAVLCGTGHQRKAGVFGRFIQPHEGVTLVVLQQDVVARHMPLDQGVLQNECLKFRADDNGIEPIHLRHHTAGLIVVGGGVLKVLAHPVFQFFGLAHIDDLPRLVHHQIDPRQQRQIVGLGPQLVLCHDIPSPHKFSLV